MGVIGLAQWLKQAASTRISLDDFDKSKEPGMHHVVVDGHFELHLACGNPVVALPLVLDDDVIPLATSVANNLNKLASVGWVITVVFDGRTPPAKGTTADSRTSDREKARERCMELRGGGGSVDGGAELGRAAVRAVHFTPWIVARVSRVLRRLLCVTCLTSPYESDAQLLLIERMLLKQGKRVLVRATDSDLIVLGVRSQLWNVVEEDGRLIGEVFTQEGVTRPQMPALSGDTEGHHLLRMLHGVDVDGTSELVWWSSVPEAVMERLLLWGSVAGNDYSKFPGIGPKKALGHCLRKIDGDFPTVPDVVESVSVATRLPPTEIADAINKSRTMALHPVVYCPEEGRQLHLSGCTSAEDVTRWTGACAPVVRKGK